MDLKELELFHLDDGSVDWTAPVEPALRVRRPGQGSAGMLRFELNARALRYAGGRGLLHDTTPGNSPCVVFGPQEGDGGLRHGNFLDAAYRAIVENEFWVRRLDKVHTAHRRAWPRTDWHWRELDAASSSDALLMNIFCFPGLLDGAEGLALRVLLGVGAYVRPEFGYKARIPLKNGRFDRTEIDLRLGNLLVEAKLTEANFQQAILMLVERYRDLDEVFGDVRADANGKVAGYQLIRGCLAALAEPGGSFCVLADARRIDLLEEWYAVMSRVQLCDLKCRLQMLTWQEIAAVLPSVLQDFLDEKYGIVPV